MTSTIPRRALALLLAALAALVWLQVADSPRPTPLTMRPAAAAPVAPAAASWASWPPGGVTVIAHRCNGGSYREATLAACATVAGAGARVLDVDVRWTSDGVPVASHDATLHLFGAPDVRIADVTWATARRYVASDGTTVARLSQLAALARASQRPLSIEPKVNPTAAQWAALDRALGSTVKDRTMLASFSVPVLKEARAAGYTRLALNVKGEPTTPSPTFVPVVIVSDKVADAPTIAAAFQGGADQVWVYGAPGGDRVRQLLELGVTGFATDDYRTAQDKLSELGVS